MCIYVRIVNGLRAIVLAALFGVSATETATVLKRECGVVCRGLSGEIRKDPGKENTKEHLTRLR